MALDRVLSSIDARRSASLDALVALLRIPSVSTKPEHGPDMVRCAQSLAGTLGQAADWMDRQRALWGRMFDVVDEYLKEEGSR